MLNQNNLMKQAQKLQNDLLRAQEKLKDMEVVGKAGGGMVKVIGKGTGDINEVKVNPEAVDPDDVEFLEDLLLAAIKDYQAEIDKLSKENMGPMANGLNLF